MKKLIAFVGAILLVASAFGAWRMWVAFRDLEAGLSAEKQKSASLAAELGERRIALEQTAAEARRSRAEAEAAARDAQMQTAAAQAADDERRQAELARLSAENTTKEALDRESRAKSELTELRERRRQELDKMQEALSKIAPTRRTASGMVVELANESFYFDFDKATLRPKNREILSRIAGVLLASEGYRLFVYGHTDDVGPDEYNQQLSLKRASSVAEYLEDAGVPEEFVKVQGFGKSSPTIRNNSADARQKNRRVEIGIVDSIIDYQ